MAHRGSRDIALPFLYHSTRRVWGVSVMPQPPLTPRKNLVPIVQDAGWVPGPVWTGAENLTPTGIWSPHHPAHSQLLYLLSYPGPPNLPCSVNLNESCICFFRNDTFTSSSDCPLVFKLLLKYAKLFTSSVSFTILLCYILLIFLSVKCKHFVMCIKLHLLIVSVFIGVLMFTKIRWHILVLVKTVQK
jgi:hypothetical protein